MARRDRFLVFGCAFLLRALLGWLFFGSVDLQKSIDLGHHLLAGQAIEMRGIPYLPSIALFLWAGTWFALNTDWPLAFGFKLAPIFADSLLAVLVGDLAGRRRPEAAGPAAWLYALCPVGPIVVALHGQWDPLALLFLGLAVAAAESGEGRPILAGSLLFASVAVKPMALVFLPFLVLLPRPVQALAGFGVSAAMLLALLAVLGFDLEWTLSHVLLYGSVGWFSFGLPTVLGNLFENRFWLILPLALAFYLYRQRRQELVGVVALGFLGVVGISGLAPQYLLWPLPFLLAASLRREAAAYAAVATVFLALFYADPWFAKPYFANTPALAGLDAAGFLSVPAWAADGRFRGPLAILGNYLLPLLGMVLFFRVAWTGHGAFPSRPVPFPLAQAGLAFLPFLVAALGLWLAAPGDAASYAAEVRDRVADYALACPAEVPRMKHITLVLCPGGTPVPDYRLSGSINIFTLLPLWAGLWSLLAWRRH